MAFSDFDVIRKLLQEMEIEKNQALCENQGLKCGLNQLKTEICRMQDTNDRLIVKLKKEDCNIKNLKDENCKLEQCIQQKEEDICCMADQCAELEKLKCLVAELERELEDQNNENCSLEENLSESMRCIQELDCTIRRLEKKLTELEQEVEEMECTIKRETEENERFRQELQDCQCNLQKLNKEYSCLCSKLKTCEITKQQLEQQIQCLQKKLDQRQIALQNEKSSGCKIQEQIKQTQDKVHKLKMENTCYHEENCELNKKRDAYMKKLKKCQCEYQRVQSECHEFKRNIERFKAQILTGVKCNANNCMPSGNTTQNAPRARGPSIVARCK